MAMDNVCLLSDIQVASLNEIVGRLRARPDLIALVCQWLIEQDAYTEAVIAQIVSELERRPGLISRTNEIVVHLERAHNSGSE